MPIISRIKASWRTPRNWAWLRARSSSRIEPSRICCTRTLNSSLMRRRCSSSASKLSLSQSGIITMVPLSVLAVWRAVELGAAAVAQRNLFAGRLAVASHDLEHAGGVAAAARVCERLQRLHQARDLFGGGHGRPGVQLSHASV